MQLTVGFIGAGNMGAAIMRGLKGCESARLVAYNPTSAKLEPLVRDYCVQAQPDNATLAREADVIVLAVKPAMIGSVIDEIAPALAADGPEAARDKVVVSLAAGITTNTLAAHAGPDVPVVRVMPNTPALVGRGLFGVCLDDARLSEAQKTFVCGLFEHIGTVHVLPESQFDAFTAIAGSGPAYVFYCMDALVEAGVTLGFTRNVAASLVEELFGGASKLAAQSEDSLATLREQVCSPAGTTIAGTNVLDERGVRAALVACAKAAAARSQELGKK